MVVDRHAVAAASTDEKPLQQGWPFPWGTVATVFSMRLSISPQLGEIGFVLFPADVARMDLLNEKQPLLLGKGLGVQRAIRMFAGLGSSETECPSVALVAQHFEHRAVLQWHPMEFAGMRTAANTAREN